MLRLMRKYQRSFVIYVFFGIIIAVFVVNFGPQSAGCAASTSYAGKVAGVGITIPDFNYAQSVYGMKSQQGSEEQLVQVRKMVMDRLIARELLAEDALGMGINIPNKEIDDLIFSGAYLALGERRPLIRGDDGNFDYDKFSRFARYYWGVTVRRFKHQQRRELLADKMRQFLRATVKVSEDEVKADFQHRNTKVKIDYVRFPPADFVAKVTAAPSAVKDFLSKNKDKVKKYFESHKNSFSKLPRQLRLQLLAINFDGKKVKAKAKIAALHKRIAGGEDFAKVAETESTDESKAAGGIIGWREAANPGLDAKVTEALGKLKVGALTEPIELDDRYLVVKVLAEREGDVKLADAEEEIAAKLYSETQSLELAKSTAAGLIKRIKAGEKIDDLFVRDEKDETKDDEAKDASDKTEDASDTSPKTSYKVATTSMFEQSAQHLIPRIGISEEISAAAFKLKKGETAASPFVVGQMVYLVALADRKDADLKEFDKKKESLVTDFTLRKYSEKVRVYTHERCVTAQKANEISINNAALVTPGYIEGHRKQGKVVQPPDFVACKTLAAPAFPGRW